MIVKQQVRVVVPTSKKNVFCVQKMNGCACLVVFLCLELLVVGRAN